MGLFFWRRRESPVERSTPTPVEILIDTVPGYVSPLARQERAWKLQGNPAEGRIQREYLARMESLYARGFPVAGHGEAGDRPRHRQRMRF